MFSGEIGAGLITLYIYGSYVSWSVYYSVLNLLIHFLGRWPEIS